MRIRLLAITLCFTAFTLITSRAEAQNTMNGEIAVVFWKPSPELSIQSGSISGATGSNEPVDFVSEFGIEDKWFTGFRASLGRKHKLNVSYAPVKYDASATITRTIVFRGQTITLGAPATANIKWDLWRFGYEWDFVSMEKGFIGVIADLKYNKMTASIASPVLTSTAETEQNAPVPTIGVAFRAFPVDMVAIGGEFSGLKFNRDDFDAKFFDFNIDGTIFFGKYLGVQGGYRSVTVDYTIDDDIGDLKLKGPWLGGLVRF
jgi:hypothetical protein